MIKKIFSLLLLIGLVYIFLNPSEVSAKVLTSNRGVIEISDTEIINDDLFVGAETVVIEGTVNGDVFIGAESVRVGGIINGDLHIVSGNVTLSGTIRDDVYIVSGNVSLNGTKIGDSLISGSGTMDIDVTSSIGGSLISGSGELGSSANVGRNLMVGAGSLYLDSVVNGEARIGSGSITLGPKTKIGKDLYYMTEEDNQFTISETASVSGVIQRIIPDEKYKRNLNRGQEGLNKAFRGGMFVWKVISFLGALLVGFLAIKLLGKSLSQVSDQISKSFWSNLGLGFAITLLSVPALILLIVTGIGIPLAGILLLVFLLTIYFAKLVVALSLGKWISEKLAQKKMSSLMQFSVGLLIIYILKSVPYVGFFGSLIIMWTGVGAIFYYFVKRQTS